MRFKFTRANRFYKKTNRAKSSTGLLTAVRLGSNMCLVVGLYSIQKFLAAFRMTNMLNTKINTFLQVTVSDDFVHDDTDSRWSDIVHDSSTSLDHNKRVNYFTIIETYPW